MTRLQKNHRLALSALMLAFALVLSWLEQLIPILPFLPPGVKLGLSNIAVMYCLFCLGLPTAALVAFLKALFVFLTRGMIAGLLSASGALLSLLVMYLVSRLPVSYLLLSVLGAIAHNIGQLLAVSLWLKLSFFSYYLPLLILSGVGMGLLTGFTLKLIMPALQRLPFRFDAHRPAS
jgi:heptaprenyl diphosphate synthase